MEKICIIIFLLLNSWTDIRKKEISLASVVICMSCGITTAVFHGDLSLGYFAAAAPGCCLIALSLLTAGAVGLGDGLILLSLGTMLSWEKVMGIILAGSLYSCVYGAILLLIQKGVRKKQIPFVPFLFAGYIGGLIL